MSVNINIENKIEDDGIIQIYEDEEIEDDENIQVHEDDGIDELMKVIKVKLNHKDKIKLLKQNFKLFSQKYQTYTCIPLIYFHDTYIKEHLSIRRLIIWLNSKVAFFKENENKIALIFGFSYIPTIFDLTNEHDIIHLSMLMKSNIPIKINNNNTIIYFTINFIDLLKIIKEFKGLINYYKNYSTNIICDRMEIEKSYNIMKLYYKPKFKFDSIDKLVQIKNWFNLINKNIKSNLINIMKDIHERKILNIITHLTYKEYCNFLELLTKYKNSRTYRYLDKYDVTKQSCVNSYHLHEEDHNVKVLLNDSIHIYPQNDDKLVEEFIHKHKPKKMWCNEINNYQLANIIIISKHEMKLNTYPYIELINFDADMIIKEFSKIEHYDKTVYKYIWYCQNE